MQDLFAFLLSLLILGGILCSIYFITEKVLYRKIQSLSEKTSKHLISKKFINNYMRFFRINELLFIILTIMYIILIFYFGINRYILFLFLLIILYSVYTIFLLGLLEELKKYINFDNSLIKSWIAKINKDIYLINRISLLLGKTSLHILIYFFGVYVIMTGYVTFEDMPVLAQYIILFIIPIGLSVFVFIDKETENLRRILIYFILLVFVFFKSYYDFNLLSGSNNKNPFNEYIFFLLLTLFTALDRFIKSLKDDYEVFKEIQSDRKITKQE